MGNFVIETEYREWNPRDIYAPEGTYILRAEPNEAFLDLDTQEQMNQFVKHLQLVDRWWPIKTIKIWKSKDNGVHATLAWEHDKCPSNIRLVQAALGSDPIRELLNLLDTEKLGYTHNILFKPADERTIRILEEAEGGHDEARKLVF